MIEMGVRQNGISDRLVRNQALRFCNDLLRARLALCSPFKENNVVFELYRHGVIRPVNAVHAVGKFFGFWPWRCRSGSRSSGRYRCSSSPALRRWWRQQLLDIRRIGIGPEQLRLECGPASSLLDNGGGELEPVVVSVIGVEGLYEHVAENWILNPSIHAI